MFGINAIAYSQSIPVKNFYQKFRYDEDYGYLRDPKLRDNELDSIKYVPLGKNTNAYLSFGGELRERYHNIQQVNFGLAEFKNDDYLLQRVLLHADLHVGNFFRTFVQFGSHHVFGKENEIRPVEKDTFDLQQAFFDIPIPVGSNKSMLRTGRQEISLGSERLVSVRNNPNIRRSFDAVRLNYVSQHLKIDTFVTKPLEFRVGTLDDREDKSKSFWGIYATLPIPLVKGLSTDVYYLGFNDDQADYLQNTAKERRHSIGTRLWGKKDSWDYDFELVYQFGHYGSADIQAWTAASNTGYRWSDYPLKPRLGFKADIISGDNDPHDHSLNTFNALFPKLAYFSQNALIVPANLINLYPYIELEMRENINLSAGWDFLWRESERDAIYINPRPLVESAQTSGHYIGSELTLDLSWQVNRYVQLTASYVHFFTSHLIHKLGGNDVDFMMLSSSYRF